MTIASTPHGERRRADRHRVFKGARISFRGLHASINCVIRDYSDSGARLLVDSPIGVPDRFDLVRDNAPTVECRVVWRKATQIGVAFISETGREIGG